MAWKKNPRSGIIKGVKAPTKRHLAKKDLRYTRKDTKESCKLEI